MKAAIYRAFRQPPTIEQVADPRPPPAGVVLAVQATGVCRSDWHGWMGDDPDITLPHVPGHEMAGTVVAAGEQVSHWKPDDRVTLPFVCGCGTCPQCKTGNQQVCDRQFQPGFTHWGSYAQWVAIDYADTNLVRVPDEMDFVTAASLGCRFATSFRAVVVQGQVTPGQWVSVFGCGGVGLAATMIATAFGARVVAVDPDHKTREFAASIGACATIDAGSDDVVGQIRNLTAGGAHVSIDAFGSAQTCFNSVSCLRKRGKHIQIGLLTGAERHAPVPMDLIVANELEVIGSHGMQAHQYARILDMISAGSLQPGRLIGREIGLGQAVEKFSVQAQYEGPGVTVISRI